MVTNISEIANAVHQLAVDKGWHDKWRNGEETEDMFIERSCNNLHNEVCELHEAWRNNQLRQPCDKAEKMRELGLPELSCLEEEMADIVIRVLDSCRRLDIDIARAINTKHQFNMSRSTRHGGKRS
jgi:NTP pyrophosphatase (non-canonical NTP hydrolase)